MDIVSVKLREIINQRFSYEELRTLYFDLGIDFDSLAGEGIAAKARELVAYMERHERLGELTQAILRIRPDMQVSPTVEPEAPKDEIAGLNVELANLRQQLIELKKESLTEGDFEHRLNDILKTANRAVGRSEELKARVILPQQEDMDVRLVPSHSFERLEEYRSDENIAYLLIGLFGGAILGILGNWVTNENFVITRVSIVLILVFALLTITCVLWTRRIHHRAGAVKDQMLHKTISSTESNAVSSSSLKQEAA